MMAWVLWARDCDEAVVEWTGDPASDMFFILDLYTWIGWYQHSERWIGCESAGR